MTRPQTAAALSAVAGTAAAHDALASVSPLGGRTTEASASLQRRAAMAREAQTQARLDRIERYRHLTRDLGWQSYRARKELRVSYRTTMRYESAIREQVSA